MHIPLFRFGWVLMGWLLSVSPIWSQIDIYKYLKINHLAQPYSLLLLKETYSTDRSKDSPYKKRYLISREEYDLQGRPSLNIYYDPEGKMTSKVIFFYPNRQQEKGIFKQKGEFMDSVVYQYDTRGQRLSEIWYWGENRTSDTVQYRYHAGGQLSKIWRKYDWDTKWDTLLYKGRLVDKCISYSRRGGMQKEVQLLYLPDSSLLKTNTINAARMVIEEEFFFYNKKGLIGKSIVKLYPEGNEIIDPPQRITYWKYHSNGQLRRTVRTDYSRAHKAVGRTVQRYLSSGYLAFQSEINRRDGIHKKIEIDYTIQKNRKLLE